MRSEQPARRPLTDDEAVSMRLQREATVAAIKQEILKAVDERPDLEQAHKFCANIRTMRSPESIHASRMVEINKWRERGVVERWSREAAVTAGGQMINARWVDEQHKEKSRNVVKDFENTRDPTLFAAASDTAVGRVVEFKAVLQNYSMFTFDVTSAYTHAREDELVFLKPSPEEIEEHGDFVWRSIRVIYGRRKSARSWQELFDSILRSEEARQRGFTVESHPKCPILYYVREADGVIELHVDDGHGCGKETIVAELFAFLSEKVEMKYVQGIWSGSYEYLKTTKVRDEKKLTSIPNKKYLQSSLNKLEMGNCKESVSMRQLKRLLRYVKGTEDMSFVFEVRDNNDRREQLVKKLEVYPDSDWASEQTTRTSTSSAVIVAERHEIACSQSWSGFSGVEQL